jgi:hypothetical protein
MRGFHININPYKNMTIETHREEVKERVAELISILQEPDDYNSKETIEFVEEELNQLERDNPEIFQA